LRKATCGYAVYSGAKAGGRWEAVARNGCPRRRCAQQTRAVDEYATAAPRVPAG